MRLAVLRALVLLGLVTAALPTIAAETKLVPIVSFFRHWDHHWYMWLPGDPVYEAVEVMSRERAVGAPPLVWVFFTERVAPKHQVHYFNDVQLARAGGGQFRDIAFAITGAQGQPRGVTVALTDADGRPVAIDVHCPPGAELVTAGAGLTNQIGHSADRLLLVFFREKNAFAQEWQVMLAGVNVARPQPGQNHPVPRPASYSSNIFVAGFPFIDRRVAFYSGGPVEQNVAHFAPTVSQGVVAAKLANGTQLELVATVDGRIQNYRHRDGGHVLDIGFEPPLPSPGQLTGEIASAYRISLNEFRDLMTGTVHVTQRDNAVVLDWFFEKPEWTRARLLQTTVVYDTDMTARIALRSAPGR